MVSAAIALPEAGRRRFENFRPCGFFGGTCEARRRAQDEKGRAMPTANFNVRFARMEVPTVPGKTPCYRTKPLRTGTQLHALGRAQSRFGEKPPAPQFAREILSAAPNAKMRPAEFYHDADEKMLRMRSHFREKSSLVLHRGRHKTFEVLQHHRASSEANPIRPPMVPIKAGREIATRRLGYFPERCFQNRGAPEVRLGF